MTFSMHRYGYVLLNILYQLFTSYYVWKLDNVALIHFDLLPCYTIFTEVVQVLDSEVLQFE